MNFIILAYAASDIHQNEYYLSSSSRTSIHNALTVTATFAFHQKQPVQLLAPTILSAQIWLGKSQEATKIEQVTKVFL
jgi:hypothetical protein